MYASIWHRGKRSGSVSFTLKKSLVVCKRRFRTAPDYLLTFYAGCLGSRVVSVLDSGAEGLGSSRSRDAVG